MSATQHTTNLHLSQFQATDIPTWMSDYNGDMMRIDNSIGNISDLVNPEGSLVDNINAFQDDVDALETLIGSATDLPVPTDTVAKNILQINNNLSVTNKSKADYFDTTSGMRESSGFIYITAGTSQTFPHKYERAVCLLAIYSSASGQPYDPLFVGTVCIDNQRIAPILGNATLSNNGTITFANNQMIINATGGNLHVKGIWLN